MTSKKHQQGKKKNTATAARGSDSNSGNASNSSNNSGSGSVNNANISKGKNKKNNLSNNSSSNTNDDAEFEQLLSDLSKITKPENNNNYNNNNNSSNNNNKHSIVSVNKRGDKFATNGEVNNEKNGDSDTRKTGKENDTIFIKTHARLNNKNNSVNGSNATNDILEALGLSVNTKGNTLKSNKFNFIDATDDTKQKDDNDNNVDEHEIDLELEEFEEFEQKLLNENVKLEEEREQLEVRRLELIRKMIDMLRQSKRAFLDSPVTEFKGSTVNDNPRFAIGVGEMQGWRSTMEDDHIIDVRFSNDNPAESTEALFGVFDGHSGGECAKLCSQRFVSLLKQHKQTASPETVTLTGDEDEKTKADKAANTDEMTNTPNSTANSKLISVNFQAAFSELDDRLRSELKDSSGCTAVLVHVSPQSITCASVGDSRAVLCRSGAALDLSSDHKPELSEEKARIEAAGGVVRDNRVNGKLAMSRAMGDFEYKNNTSLNPSAQLVIAQPRVISVARETVGLDNDAFIVIACDGIFDVLSNDELVQMILEEKKELKEDGSMKSNEEICEIVCRHCLAPANPDTSLPARSVGTDNMTIMIVDLLSSEV